MMLVEGGGNDAGILESELILLLLQHLSRVDPEVNRQCFA